MFKWLGDILGGDRRNGGQRHVTSKGATYTRGVAKDKKASGGTYLSVKDSGGNKKPTRVWDKQGKRVK